MERDQVEFWVSGAHGEWGTLDTETAHKLGKRRGFRRSSGRGGIKGWVESFMAAMKRDGTFLLVESKDEFRYLYRCFENLSMPLSYCPVAPHSRHIHGGKAVTVPNRLAA